MLTSAKVVNATANITWITALLMSAKGLPCVSHDLWNVNVQPKRLGLRWKSQKSSVLSMKLNLKRKEQNVMIYMHK